MRPSLCATCLAFLLKLLIFLQTFTGISIVIYAIWVLDRWHHHGGDLGAAGAVGMALGDLPGPWFAYLLMGLGIAICVVAFAGHVAAEAINGCCLCFYALLTTAFMLLEAVIVCFMIFDKHWEEDLPNDSTGELRRLRTFIEANTDICKFAGLTMIVIQAFSLLLSVTLRAILPRRRSDEDSDDDITVVRQPLINPQYPSNPILTSADGKGIHSDIWSSRIRQKYGLNQGEFSGTNGDHKV